MEVATGANRILSAADAVRVHRERQSTLSYEIPGRIHLVIRRGHAADGPHALAANFVGI